MTTTISVFNNKGGVGKTSIIWNLAISLADQGKSVLLIDFDAQCNLSIACLGSNEFSQLLESSDEYPFGQTIKAFALPYIQQNRIGDVHSFQLKHPSKRGVVHIVPGDFWLNTFSDILNVGTDVISGSGLYRFILPHLIAENAAKHNAVEYDYVLIDLPPSFNTLVRSALYCSDYFLVPCTPDMFSAYCVGLIGEMLPAFVRDWEQGKERYLTANSRDKVITAKGMPKFGGWIFNGFDTRTTKGVKHEVGADAEHHLQICKSIKEQMIPQLEAIANYDAVPDFVEVEPVAMIEDLNVMAPDSIIQSVPIKYLHLKQPTQRLRNRRKWAPNQVNLMSDMADQYDALAKHIIDNFE
ncbi:MULTISPECIES: ParA family protein [Pseudomonas]|uniref:ParA family protein n=1 Tax=Pseudomonas asiatica TaxID=2219225 RepID=A0ABU5KYT1_9PSED|nr:MULTISPECIES: ParA family protein [Pseudomonas]MDQ7965325.1 ParA family protein [Pseudomonas plecoglossicida]MDZ5739066.1 ParA family protein [Pseudomonas asiatica]MDZ5743762.1 ParA family protein [Pseudomonas asiatica]MDZ5749300.1 ParA family protein [Pseudomonas asiatica]MDZ5754331.1 ParA family protein [Pseudomonas asiatica]